MFLISNDSNGLKNGMNKYNCDNRTKGPEEWKGFKNKFYRSSELLVTVSSRRIDNKSFLSTNGPTLGI